MIRVLRLIEYQYDTTKRMVDDMFLWTIQHRDPSMRMQSVHLDPHLLPDPDPSEQERALVQLLLQWYQQDRPPRHLDRWDERRSQLRALGIEPA